MPGWGTGSFENEEAQKFLEELAALVPSDLKEMLARAAEREDYLQASESSLVVAAAEIVATAKGAPPRAVPLQIAEWVRQFEGAPSTEMTEVARRAVDKVRTNSELKDLWQEADGLNDWSEGLRELDERLGKEG